MPRDFDKILNAGIEGFKLKCPRCGKGKIFKSIFTLKANEHCPECGYHIGAADIGDGPAYFAICIAGVLIPVLAILVEALYSPSYIVHALIWVPLLIISSWLVLLYSKSILISLEYKIRELEDKEPK